MHVEQHISLPPIPHISHKLLEGPNGGGGGESTLVVLCSLLFDDTSTDGGGGASVLDIVGADATASSGILLVFEPAALAATFLAAAFFHLFANLLSPPMLHSCLLSALLLGSRQHGAPIYNRIVEERHETSMEIGGDGGLVAWLVGDAWASAITHRTRTVVLFFCNQFTGALR